MLSEKKQENHFDFLDFNSLDSIQLLSLKFKFVSQVFTYFACLLRLQTLIKAKEIFICSSRNQTVMCVKQEKFEEHTFTPPLCVYSYLTSGIRAETERKQLKRSWKYEFTKA